MQWWSLAPGSVLIAAGFVLQFGSYLRRPRPIRWVLTAVRLRFIGYGALVLGIGLDFVISDLLAGPSVGSLLIGLFVLALAGTWFYAASDRIFRGPDDS